METHGKQYKWKIVVWSVKRRHEKKWTLQESKWFDRKEDCIANFKEKIKNGNDIADSCGSEEYLLKRRVTPKKYFPHFEIC